MDREEYKKIMLARGVSIKEIEQDFKELDELLRYFVDYPDFESWQLEFIVNLPRCM